MNDDKDLAYWQYQEELDNIDEKHAKLRNSGAVEIHNHITAPTSTGKFSTFVKYSAAMSLSAAISATLTLQASINANIDADLTPENKTNTNETACLPSVQEEKIYARLDGNIGEVQQLLSKHFENSKNLIETSANETLEKAKQYAHESDHNHRAAHIDHMHTEVIEPN